MRTLLLGADGDLELDGEGALRMVDGSDELAQAVRLRLETAAGEWFADTEFGLDHSAILGKGISPERARAEVLRTLLAEERVEAVEDIAITHDAAQRTTAVAFRARGSDDEVAVGEVSIG